MMSAPRFSSKLKPIRGGSLCLCPVGRSTSLTKYKLRSVRSPYAVYYGKRTLICRAETVSTDNLHLFVERSQHTLRSLYIKALPGPLAWAPSFLVPAAAGLSIFGGCNGHRLLHLLQGLQWFPQWFPMSHFLSDQYAQHTFLADTAFDTLLSTLAALLVFVGMPFLDLVLGLDPKEPAQVKGRDSVYKGMLYTHVFLYWGLVAASCEAAGTAHCHPLTLLGMTASIGCAGAMNFVVAHELLHSSRKADRRMASIALMPSAYSHWVVSHIAHHVKVGQMEDPTTARLGESLYRYVSRSVTGNLEDGVRAELQRLKSRGLPFFCIQNRIFEWAGGPLLLLAGVYGLWGIWAAALGVGQALFGIVMLECVNYIEHYGLRRKQLAESGMYERVTIHHSWNANWLFTNSVIFSLQRHSDHHENAYKPYQRLEDIPQAPQLPASYPAVMILALLPGLFRDVMDPRAALAEHESITRPSSRRLKA